MLSTAEQFTIDDMLRLRRDVRLLSGVLAAIQAEAHAELLRIERDGGCAGFALRVKALCEEVAG